MGMFNFCGFRTSRHCQDASDTSNEVYTKNATQPPPETHSVTVDASSRADLPRRLSPASIVSNLSSGAPPPREKQEIEQKDPTKALFDKKTSFSTLTAWQILAFNVVNSSESLAAIPENEHLDLPPPPPPMQSSLQQSSPALNQAPGSPFWSNEKVESQYELLEQLGYGAFGKVFKAKRRRDGALACVKIINLPGPSEAVAEEVSTLRALRHPHIVHLYGAYCDADQRTAIAMELCAGGDLEKWLKAHNNSCPSPLTSNYLTEAEIMHCFVQIWLALQHVHNRGILHRDIKASNIFLSTCASESTKNSTPLTSLFDYTIKLGDFGIAKALEPGQSCAKTMLGTPCYFSPEIISDKPYNKKSDVWAAGCVLYELCALKRPFQGNSVSAVCVKILAGAAPPLPATCSTDLGKLVELLLSKDPRKRPSISTVLEIPFVQKYYKIYTQWRQDRGLGSIAEEESRIIIADQIENERVEAGGEPFSQYIPPPSETATTSSSLSAVSLIGGSSSSSQEAVTVAQRVLSKGSDGRSSRRQAEGECRGEFDGDQGEVQYAFAS